MANLDQAATKELDRVDLDPRLRELIRIRASQLNGCAYCIDTHTKDARAIGETEQRLYALPAWKEAPFFTDRERAALAFTESVTTLATDHVPSEAYDAVAAAFTTDGRGVGQPDRHHQRVERHRREHTDLGTRVLSELTHGPSRVGHARHGLPAGGRASRSRCRRATSGADGSRTDVRHLPVRGSGKGAHC